MKKPERRISKLKLKSNSDYRGKCLKIDSSKKSVKKSCSRYEDVRLNPINSACNKKKTV